MAVAELVVNLVAGTAKFSSGMKSAVKDLDKFGRKMTRIGRDLSSLSAPFAVIGGASAKFGVDFDRAFTGVKKTLDGTPQQFAALRKEILELSKATGTSAVEISKIAETAGQLGVQIGNVGEFAKHINALANSAADLSAEDAATQLAQFLTVTGSSIDTVGNLAGTITVLGNNLATTEGKVSALSQNIAAAGSEIGMTDAQIVGLAGAIATTGIEAEKGGTAISKVLRTMSIDIATNSSNLEVFAKTTGQSVEEFSKAFREDAAGALVAFLQGLKKSGEASVILKQELQGFGNERVLDTLGRLTNSLNDPEKGLIHSLEMASVAYQEGDGHTKEFEKKIASLSGQLDVAKANIIGVGIAVGEVLLPPLVKLSTWVAKLAGEFSKLDPWLKELIVWAGTFVGGVGPVLFVIGKMAAAFAGLGTLLAGSFKIALIAVAALLSPVGAIAVGVAAVVAALVLCWDEFKAGLQVINQFTQDTMESVRDWVQGVAGYFNQLRDDVINTVTDMMDGVRDRFIRGLGVIKDYVKDSTDAVGGFFKDLWDRVVGNSYVPDMMDGIEREIKRAGPEMVEPMKEATEQVAGGFQGLESEIGGTVAGIGSEVQGLGGVFDDLTGVVNSAFSNILGDVGGIGSSLSSVLGEVSNLLSGQLGGSGSGGLGGLLSTGISKLFDTSIFSGGGSGFGPVASGSEYGGMLEGAGSSIGYASAAIKGIGALVGGGDSEEVGTGIGSALGTAAGAAFGGPFGAMAGSQLGSVLGEAVGGLFGGGPSNPETLARIAFQDALNGIVDGKNIKLINEDGVLEEFQGISFDVSNKFNEEWASTFEDVAGSANTAFSAAGTALGNFFGVTEEVGAQMGFVLAEHLNGNLENLGRLLNGMDVPIEKMEEEFLNMLENGQLSVREFVIALRDIRGGFEAAESASKDVTKAIGLLLQTSGDSMESVRAIKALANAAKEEGIDSIEALSERMLQSGQLTEEQVAVHMDALAAHGIGSVEQFANAGTETLASILAFMTSVAIDGGSAFFQMFDNISSGLDSVANQADRAASKISNSLNNIQAPDLNVTPSAMGNIFSHGKIQQFQRGGVVSRPSFFDIGSMAEVGPEAIMPLSRNGEGELGVKVAEGGGKSEVHINFNGEVIEGSFVERVKSEIAHAMDSVNGSLGRAI